MQQPKFHYATFEELQQELQALQITLPLSQQLALLHAPATVGGRVIPNRLAIQPMEGCDGTADGSPDELTCRRYRRFAASGAGLIWFEAVAILPEARANPRQLMLTRANLPAFRALTDEIRAIARQEQGIEPLLILQATHSGRYSKPEGRPAPLIACNNPLFEGNTPLPDGCIVSDDYLASLPAAYAATAALAQEAGFDGVDIKACHRYLLSELLAAHTRPGRYGGSFENRTRLLREAMAAAKAAVSGQFIVTSRMNLYDGFPRPYGWGVGEEGIEPDLAEPIALLAQLQREQGLQLLDCTIGNPYVNPHVNRPYDAGPYPAPEHPLAGVARMCRCISQVKKALPSLTIVASGLSYLRQFSPQLAAGILESGGADLAGFGREAFAYPAFAAEILGRGALDPKKCCIACGKCSELMRAGSVAGCVVRDSDVYLPIYRQAVQNAAR